MRDIDNKNLMIGVPDRNQGRSGTIALLKKAEIPVKDLLGSFNQTIWFDRNTQAVKIPNAEQRVNSVELGTFLSPALRELVARGIFDMAIRSRRAPLKADRQDTLRLVIPGRTRTETLPGELILGEPIDPEVVRQVRESGQLRGIEGFRNRLVASIVRASEHVAQEAYAASLEAATRRTTMNYQAAKDGAKLYLPY